MPFKYIQMTAFILSACALSACTGETDQPGQNTNETIIGYVDSGCFVTEQAGLAAGDNISVYSIATSETMTAEISDANMSGNVCGTFQTANARAVNSDLNFHALSDPLDYAVAWKVDPNVKSIMDTLKYSSCTTSEGLRYRAINPESGDIVWEGYQHLGYDTESDCKN